MSHKILAIYAFALGGALDFLVIGRALVVTTDCH